MRTKFLDKDGNLICFNKGSDPQEYAKLHGFEEGWTFELIEEEEYRQSIKHREGERRFAESPHEQVAKLRKDHEALLEVLQELHGGGVNIKGMIEAKKKAK